MRLTNGAGPSVAGADPPTLSLKPHLNGSVRSGAETETQHENEWYRSVFDPKDYHIKEQPLYTQRPMRILIVGAGAAGLNIAYKALRQLRNVSFTIYEKNDDVGGTWLENRYPGCTCDIPSHAYQFSFFRKPDWSSYYAGAEEIRQYLKSLAVEHNLLEHVNFGHRVEEARWDEEDGTWCIQGRRKDGSKFEDRGEILASCHGVLKYACDTRYSDRFAGG